MEFVSYDIASNDFRRAGAASRSIKEHLKRIGADAEAIRRTMIAAYEAEMNVVIHSMGGRLEASLTDSQIDVNVVDEGPGIADVEQAMVEGYSTAGAEARALGFGAGMGLPNIKRNSDRLRITSRLDEGTRVSFTVYLRPESTDGPRPISLYASADRCRDCRACLAACPTQAMRIRDGSPSVLEHLCIDCAQCIAACSTRALTIRDEIASLDDLAAREDMTLIVPPALLASCGPDYPPAQVLAALEGLGFRDVIMSAPFEEALRLTAGPATGKAASVADEAGSVTAKPVIVPSCPAVVNLIELRFPSLVPHLAPFDSPWEAAQATYGDRSVAYVVSCPSQRSALLLQNQGPSDSDDPSRQTEYLAPEVIRQAVMMKLAGGDAAGPATAGGAGAAADGAGVRADEAGVRAVAPTSDTTTPPATEPALKTAVDRVGTGATTLRVSGIEHVMAVLEKIEDGLLDDVDTVEPYSCDGGCFGSPLIAEDYHVAAFRWSRDREAVDAAMDPLMAGKATAVPRRRPFAPRTGIRLDPDMSRAILKLGELQAVIRSLPGRDCGACGAPTCAGLAEDVVMQRASVDLCPYREGEKEDRG